MSIHTTGTPENVVLAQNVNGRLRAETKIIAARAFLFRSLGFGAFCALAGIGLGAIIGGSVIQHLGLGAVGYVAAAIAILAVLVTPVVNRLKSQGAS